MNHYQLITHLSELLACLVRGTGDSTEAYLHAIRDVDEIAKSQRRVLPGELIHFLQNRSYVKAVNFIDKMEPNPL